MRLQNLIKAKTISCDEANAQLKMMFNEHVELPFVSGMAGMLITDLALYA